MKQTLYSARQAHQVVGELWLKIKAAIVAGHKLEIEVTKVTKSREQEKKYHSMIGEIAQQAQHLGAKWNADDWKRMLVDQFSREKNLAPSRFVPALDGSGIVQLGLQTRKFKVDEASDFIEWLYAWGAENGIAFSEN